MKVETFSPHNLFKPIGPYSHIAKSGSFIAISGTFGIDSDTQELAKNDAYLQTLQIIKNFRIMLEHVESSLQDVMHVNVFLKNAEDFSKMNRAYEEEFSNHLPARTVICVADFPKKDALLMMDLTAIISSTL